MDFWFAAFVVVSMIGIVLCSSLMLEKRSLQRELRATRAELAACSVGRSPAFAKAAPRSRVDPDVPERLGELLRMVQEDIRVPLTAIPPSLRKSGQPIEIQKLAVILQDPEAKPDEFEPLWVDAIANLVKTNPDATLGEITREFNRLVALEEASSQTPVPPSPEDEATAARGAPGEAFAFPERPSFQALYQEHVAGVFAAVRRFGVPEKEAEDVAGAVFVAVYQALDPWLKTITYRTVRDHLKRGGKG
jgi:hypothetical protein